MQFECIFSWGFGLPQAKPDGFASSLGEGASGVPANLALTPETANPSGEPQI